VNKILVVGTDLNVLQLLKSKLPDYEFVTENSERSAVLMINLDDKSISLSEVEEVLIPEIEIAFEYHRQESQRGKKLLIVDDGTVNFAEMMIRLDEQKLSNGDIQNILMHEVHQHLYMPKVQVKLNPADRYYHNHTKPYGKKHRQRF
jgi:hypothetical protein